MAPTYHITTLTKPAFDGNSALFSRMARITAPSYVEPIPLLQREISRGTKLYILSTEEEEVASFFIVSEATLPVATESRPFVYLGLSATSLATKNTGVVRELYCRCAADIRASEHGDAKARTIWFTTATPSAYYGGSLYWQVEPSPDGCFSRDALGAADEICAHFGYERKPEDHPFVLRAAAGTVRYSDQEIERVRRVLLRTGFELFSRLGIQEACGDRLLVVCQSKTEAQFRRGGGHESLS